MADVTNTAAPTMANAGKPIARYEARQKVTGGKIYGTITAIDDSAAKAVPGVLMIMTHENRPPLQPMKTFSTGGIGLTSQEPLGGPEIAHDGQIVALIVAETFEAPHPRRCRGGTRRFHTCCRGGIFDACSTP